jgi:hypothetical protein
VTLLQVHANREPLVLAPDRLLQRLIELLYVPIEGDCALIVKHVREAQQPIAQYEHDAAIDTEVRHCKHLSAVLMHTMGFNASNDSSTNSNSRSCRGQLSYYCILLTRIACANSIKPTL